MLSQAISKANGYDSIAPSDPIRPKSKCERAGLKYVIVAMLVAFGLFFGVMVITNNRGAIQIFDHNLFSSQQDSSSTSISSNEDRLCTYNACYSICSSNSDCLETSGASNCYSSCEEYCREWSDTYPYNTYNQCTLESEVCGCNGFIKGECANESCEQDVQ